MRSLPMWGILSAGLLSLSIAAAAQSVGPRPAGRLHSVKLGMAPVVAGGFHVSGEKLWSPASRSAWVVTPQLYYGPVSNFTSDLSEGQQDRVRGYGLDVQHRIYLGEETTGVEGFYIAYGPSYQHFRLAFQSRSWAPELGANGLTYYEYRLRPQTEVIDRYGVCAVIGTQTFLPGTPLFVDAFLGIGLRKASSRSTVNGTRYTSGMSDYGHEGSYIPLGFRIGAAW
ncbi:hypothetical protein [Hymenobacter glacieicola]|uniref:DUF3575 domain-containing protein n=1 Tax=Hymenobacter glacieicola TaxID=1562124 RepID=A0ABQ1X1Q4_9BACT|nr:hypothetical protein [Hymenobacter glacieicola]GGG51782.1 hypothetical protein GCM10011378_30010 [Hymenobacter glacieicola]